MKLLRIIGWQFSGQCWYLTVDLRTLGVIFWNTEYYFTCQLKHGPETGYRHFRLYRIYPNGYQKPIYNYIKPVKTFTITALNKELV